jgi:hypothetical protein
VSEEVVEQKDLDKRVRALTTLTKYHDIPALAADFFDSERPLPSVHILLLTGFIRLVSVVLLFLLIVWQLCFCRAINSLFLVLLYQRKDLFRLILFLLHPKPPRLRKVRTEMMPKIHWRELARPCHLLLQTQKTLVSIERGNMSRSSFLRVPPLLRLLSGSLLLLMKMRNFSTS